MVVQGVVMKNLMITLDLDQPRVVLGEGLKDTHEHLYQGNLEGAIVARLLMDEVHDPKMHFQRLWT
jgi:hypothetical protein